MDIKMVNRVDDAEAQNVTRVSRDTCRKKVTSVTEVGKRIYIECVIRLFNILCIHNCVKKKFNLINLLCIVCILPLGRVPRYIRTF